MFKSSTLLRKTTGERLRAALQTRRYSMADLAKALNIKHQIIQFLCNSNTKSSKYFLPISNFLEISIEWLLEDNGEMELPNDIKGNIGIASIHTRKIPIYDTYEFSQTVLNQNKSQARIISYLHINAETGKKTFGLQLKDQAMFPRFPEKTLIVIDPEKNPETGCFLLVYIKNAGEIYFRLYCERSTGEKELVALNKTTYKDIILLDEDIILGTMIEARFIP